MNTFKVIIAGSRTFNNYQYVTKVLDKLLSKKTIPIEIVSGGARGADSLGERYAKERGYKLTIFPADWNSHGKRGGILRNIKMGDYSDAAVVFRVNFSRGSTHMIEYAKKKGLQVRVFDV